MTAEKNVSPEWITIKEAQKVLGGVSDKTVRRYIKKYKILTSGQYTKGVMSLLLAQHDVEALVKPGQTIEKIRGDLSRIDRLDSTMDTLTKMVRARLDGIDRAIAFQQEQAEDQKKAAEDAIARQEEKAREDAEDARRRIRRAAAMAVIVAVILSAVILWAVGRRGAKELQASRAAVEDVRGMVEAHARDQAAITELRSRLEAVEKAKQGDQRGQRSRFLWIF